MYKTVNEGYPTPTANLAINKSRIKLYSKTSKVPTYYLQKGQEFQMELFNPTKDTIMAKIFLNGKPIAQGGLVLKPAQRVFLDRYIDVANKFKFDTYEVANTSESRAAIEDNGDFKVEFYKERTPVHDYNHAILRSVGTFNDGTYNGNGNGGNNTTNAPHFGDLTTNTCNTGDFSGQSLGLTNMSSGVVNASASNYSADNMASMDFLDFMPQELNRDIAPERKEIKTKGKTRRRLSKKIETGRVEAGSKSDQSLTTVYMNWEYTPFHTVEYKMLPVSQKINTVDDIQVKRYCTACGGKTKSKDKFCSSCGDRI